MPTNFYFNNIGASQEQLLIEDLVIESIRIYGIEVYYIPRKRISFDNIYSEDDLSEFNNSYLVEMYVRNVEGFEGEGDFLSKFNIEIRDQMTLTIANRVFDEEVGSIEGFKRPREGDLIFLPLNKKIFQVKFVEHEPVFYQLGALQMYDLKLELFEYSNEIMNTGIEEIDNLQTNFSTALNNFSLLTESGLELRDQDGFSLVLQSFDLDIQDNQADNDEIQTESDNIIDFTEVDPFSEGGNY